MKENIYDIDDPLSLPPRDDQLLLALREAGVVLTTSRELEQVQWADYQLMGLQRWTRRWTYRGSGTARQKHEIFSPASPIAILKRMVGAIDRRDGKAYAKAKAERDDFTLLLLNSLEYKDGSKDVVEISKEVIGPGGKYEGMEGFSDYWNMRRSQLLEAIDICASPGRKQNRIRDDGIKYARDWLFSDCKPIRAVLDFANLLLIVDRVYPELKIVPTGRNGEKRPLSKNAIERALYAKKPGLAGEDDAGSPE